MPAAIEDLMTYSASDRGDTIQPSSQTEVRAVAVNRTQWQEFAERWLIDAKHLLDNHRWAAAYYLAGYAVECGLKACVLVRKAMKGLPASQYFTKCFIASSVGRR